MKNYIMVGAGGTGSILAPHLLRQLFKVHGEDFCLIIVDGDLVEDKNLSRQDYKPEDVGHNKAEVLACQLARVKDPVDLPLYLEPQPVYLDSRVADVLIKEGDTILICVDNFRARADIERKAIQLQDVTVINGGNEATTASVQIFARRNGQNLTPHLSYMHPELLTNEIPRGEQDCQMRAAATDDEQTIGANLLSAAFMLAAVAHVQRMHTIADNVNTLGADELPTIMWHETHANIDKGKATGTDWREVDDLWRQYEPPTLEAIA